MIRPWSEFSRRSPASKGPGARGCDGCIFDPMRYQRDPGWAFKSVLNDTSAILVPLISSQADLTALFQLNSTGAFLWGLLERPRGENELLDELKAAFDTGSIPDEELHREVHGHLRDLVGIGALRESCPEPLDRS